MEYCIRLEVIGESDILLPVRGAYTIRIFIRLQLKDNYY